MFAPIALPIELMRPAYYPNQTRAFGSEAQVIYVAQEELFKQLTQAETLKTQKQRFATLSKTWKENTMFSSSLNELLLNPSYLEVISMGKDALPFIFEELNNGDNSNWFLALRIITKINPVPVNSNGDYFAMKNAWINWAKENKYVS